MALFVDRARAVRPGFALTASNAAAVAAICRRLEGLPLAIELAAARTRLLDPAGLLGRLTASLDSLGTGAVDLPDRQRTLRATVEWSVGLLDDDERSLLETVAVFTDGWTIDAAARLAGLEEDRALDLLEALARQSLVQLDLSGDASRCRMLETVRAFVAERLTARPDAAEVQRRHAYYYRALVEQADRPLRGAGQSEWLERLQAEARNLAAAVHWYLAHDPTPLPHLFRILWPFWFLRDRQAEARPLGRGTAARRLVRPLGPGRTGMDGDGDCQRGGRRPGSAGCPPTPGTAAGGDPGPPAACNMSAGYGLDFADHRRLRACPEGGVGHPGRAP